MLSILKTKGAKAVHWKSMFAYEHLGCQDLPREEGTNKVLDLVVSIKSIAVRDVKGEGGKVDKKPVAALDGAGKPFIVNKTNLLRLEQLFGSTEIEDFVGKPFILCQERVKDFGGGMTIGLRVKVQKTEAKPKPEFTPDSPRWAAARTALKEGNTTLEAIKGTYFLTPENEAKLLKK